MAIMTLGSVVRKYIFRFVAQQIRCAHNFFSPCCVTHQKAVFCGENGQFTFSVCETEQDVNSSNVNKYKTFGDALSCRVASQNVIVGRNIFVTSVGDLKLNSKSQTVKMPFLETVLSGASLYQVAGLTKIHTTVEIVFHRAIRTPSK